MESTKTPDMQEAAVPESQFISYLDQSEGYSIGEVQRF